MPRTSVAAAGEPGAVVALDPQGVVGHVEVGGQARHRFERRRQVGEGDAAVKRVDPLHLADATVGLA